MCVLGERFVTTPPSCLYPDLKVLQRKAFLNLWHFKRKHGICVVSVAQLAKDPREKNASETKHEEKENVFFCACPFPSLFCLFFRSLVTNQDDFDKAWPEPLSLTHYRWNYPRDLVAGVIRCSNGTMVQ